MALVGLPSDVWHALHVVPGHCDVGDTAGGQAHVTLGAVLLEGFRIDRFQQGFYQHPLIRVDCGLDQEENRRGSDDHFVFPLLVGVEVLWGINGGVSNGFVTF